jgi:glycosyltransferase involved in cell wall biosynthesis
LAIIGDGPSRAELEEQARARRVTEYSWIAGARGDVQELLRGLELFVMPSRAEGASNKILEAMSSGLPVVATDVGGISELVVAGETGTLVPHSASLELAAALRRNVTDAVLCRAHGAAGRARAQRLFSLDAMVAEYLRLYDRFCSKRGLSQRQS